MEARNAQQNQLAGSAAPQGALTSFHGFMQLPLEVRTIIYEHALCPGIVYLHAEDLCCGDYTHLARHCFSTYRDMDRDDEIMPGQAHDYNGNRRLRYVEWERIKNTTDPVNQTLLRAVSKTVQAEASAVFYGPKNHFVLPCGSYDYPKSSGHPCAYSPEIPDIPPCHSISYTFDMRDIHWDPWEIRESVKDMFKDEIAVYAMTHTKRDIEGDLAEKIHTIAEARLAATWEKRCEIMRQKLAASFLQIDFEECYCALGCCRMVEDVCENLGPFLHRPGNIEIIGLKDEDEATRVKDRISFTNCMEANRIVCKDARGNVLKPDQLIP